MPESDPEGPTCSRRMDEVLAEYMTCVDQGETNTRERLLAQHPDLADDLRSYFDACDELGSLARPVEPITGVNGDAFTTEKVRYFGDYEMVDEIGRGGMGLVFRARQISLNRPVALKMILTGPWASPGERFRFQVEAEAAARLDHAHIVPIFEIGEHLGYHYYSMKLIEGKSLLSHVSRFASDHRAAATLVSTVARAVHYAHQRGVLHRDLKPANILVDEFGEPHVADFGLAKLDRAQGVTATGDVLGTPAYMAPEQAQGKYAGITTSADVYGLGAILYHLLAGSPPFDGDSGLEILKQVQDRMPRSLRVINPRIDRDIETITLRCLDKDPDRRYRSARELAEDLDRWLAGVPILARPVGPCSRLMKWARRHPGVAMLSGTVLAVTLAGTLISTWQAHVARMQWKRAELALVDLGKAYKEIKTQGQKLEAALIHSESEVYGQSIARAELEIKSGRIPRAAQFLELARPAPGRPDFRGWEWRYLNQLCRTEQLVLRGHRGRIWGIAYGPEGKWLVSCGEDRTARVWDLTTKREKFVYREHVDIIRAIAVGRGGKHVATGGDDKVVRVWSPSGGQTIRSWECEGKIQSIAFSNDGKLIAAGGQSGLACVWDVETGKKVLTLELSENEAIYHVSFDENDRLLTTAKRAGLQSWTLKREGHAEPKTLDDSFHYTAQSLPDGGGVIVAGDNWTEQLAADSGRIHAGHAPTGTTGPSSAFGATHEGDPSIVILLSKSEPMRFRGHTAPVLAVASHHSGKHFATGGRDSLIHVWSLSKNSPLRTYAGHGQEVTSLTFSPDGHSLASAGGDGTVRIWDADVDPAAVVLADSTHLPKSVAYDSEGTVIATAGVQGTVMLWDPKAGKPIATLIGHGAIVHALAFHPRGKLLISGGGDPSRGELIAWDLDTGKIHVKLPGHTQALQSIAFNATGDLFATASLDGSLRIWNGENLRPIRIVSSGVPAVRAVAFSPDGTVLASAGNDRRVRLWSTKNWDLIGTLDDHEGQVWSLAFGPDDLLASGGDDRVIRLWKWRSRDPAGQLSGHSGLVRSLSFSNDGRLASVSADGTVRVWDVAQRREVLALFDHLAYPTWVVFSPDGSALATCSMDGTTRVRVAPPLADGL